MVKLIGTLFIVLLAFNVKAGVIVLEGNYQGKNLYIQNPFASSGVGFCVSEVTINGEVSTDEINSSAFEIDLSVYNFKNGDKIEIKIKHKDDCKPKVLNPEVLKPKSTFEVISMKVEKDGTLKWVTKNESGKLPYVVEQFRWNKWVKIGEVQGKGMEAVSDYSTKVPEHSGENKFRVKQIDFSGNPRYSDVVKLKSTSPEVQFGPIKVSNEIMFSDETMFEVYDTFGNIVKKGTGKNVDVSSLPKGIYYLNYDNKSDKFVKK
ncbi:MAG: T9SS type A sorting domain-containing protein [Bacteroidia bacterium]|nr:T9SS type A sorting domain-containing protein [Bacteroidia bacterium]